MELFRAPVKKNVHRSLFMVFRYGQIQLWLATDLTNYNVEFE